MNVGHWHLWPKSNPNAHAFCLHVWIITNTSPEEGDILSLYSTWHCDETGMGTFGTKIHVTQALKLDFRLFLHIPKLTIINMLSFIKIEWLSKYASSRRRIYKRNIYI